MSELKVNKLIKELIQGKEQCRLTDLEQIIDQIFYELGACVEVNCSIYHDDNHAIQVTITHENHNFVMNVLHFYSETRFKESLKRLIFNNIEVMCSK